MRPRHILSALLFLLALASVSRTRGEVYFSTQEQATNLVGTVTFHRASDPYYFMADDAGNPWRIKEADDRVRVKPGDRVVVAGVMPRNNATPRLDKAVSRKVGKGQVPATLEMTVDDLYALDPDGEEGRRSWYGKVVVVSGVVSDVNRRETFAQVLVGKKGRQIHVAIPLRWDDPMPEGLQFGAVVRVKGVAVYTAEREAGTGRVRALTSFNVLPARLADVRVVNLAPFWTIGRVALVAGSVVALMLVVVALQRRGRIRERIAADAARRERLRLTSELHDNFQQLLAGCMFRLGAAMGKVGKDDAAAKNQMELLRNSLNHTQASLRAALWGLTEEAEGPAALTELIRYAASRLPQWEGVVRFTIRGKERAVARQCSGALLLLLQEAVGNALKHGGATRVDIVVDFTERALIVGVTDNGCGFDATKTVGAGHLGLATMRKHAEGLGGTFFLSSAPGKGTSISIRIPL